MHNGILTYVLKQCGRSDKFKFTKFLITKIMMQNFIFTVISYLYHVNNKVHQNVQQINAQTSQAYSVS